MIEYGKIPPQATEIEEALLGSLMMNNNSYEKVEDIISAESFYKESNKEIYKAIQQLKKENNPIDILTVTEKLKKNDRLEAVGGSYAITMLTEKVVPIMKIENHAAIIKEKHMLRNLISLSSTIMSDAFSEGDPFEIIKGVQDSLVGFSGFNRSNIKHITEILKDITGVIDFNIKNKGQLTGVPTGFNKFDSFSNGMQPGDLVIIAGETSNGKTALALNIALNASKFGKKIAIYSYEMSDRQLSARLLAGESGVGSKEILTTALSNAELERINVGMGSLGKYQIYIDDLPTSNYEYLERSIRSMVLKEKTDLVVIDYLQLIGHSNNNLSKMQQVADISNDLKKLAKTLNIPIILLSQLSRDRQNPKPTLSRLKGSGDIENAADVVWFVWRPELYNYPNFECDFNVFDSVGNSHHIIAKGRNIGITEFVLGFSKEITKFTNEIRQNEMNRF